MSSYPIPVRAESKEQLERLRMLCTFRAESFAQFFRRHIEADWEMYGEAALEAHEALQKAREKAGLE